MNQTQTAERVRATAYRSRDLTETRGAVAAPQRQRVHRTIPRVSPPRRRFQRQAGSQQRFTDRGRRIERPRVDVGRIRTLSGFLALIVAGIAIAIYLSGAAADQTRQLGMLKQQQTTLNNQIETLNRDLEDASSTAEVARRAGELGMVVPDQPGVLTWDPEGALVEIRAAGGTVRPVADVNADSIRANVTSSNPAATAQVQEQLTAVIPPAVPEANVAPYTASTGN